MTMVEKFVLYVKKEGRMKYGIDVQTVVPGSILSAVEQTFLKAMYVTFVSETPENKNLIKYNVIINTCVTCLII